MQMFKFLKNIFIPKFWKRKPIMKTGTYNKYGFVKTECTVYCCPRCENILNAGPNYQPNCCVVCGQMIDYSDISWIADKELGYVERREF